MLSNATWIWEPGVLLSLCFHRLHVFDKSYWTPEEEDLGQRSREAGSGGSRRPSCSASSLSLWDWNVIRHGWTSPTNFRVPATWNWESGSATFWSRSVIGFVQTADIWGCSREDYNETPQQTTLIIIYKWPDQICALDIEDIRDWLS